jgi:hypothetical protein
VASLAAGEVCLEEFEGVGHVGPAEADADVVWLVVNRARQEQDADLGQPRAVSGEVIDPGDAGEADRACRRAYPFEGFGVPLEEAVEEGQVAPHDREVAVEESVAVAQRTQDPPAEWDKIDWRAHEGQVRRLRQRIFKAATIFLSMPAMLSQNDPCVSFSAISLVCAGSKQFSLALAGE